MVEIEKEPVPAPFKNQDLRLSVDAGALGSGGVKAFSAHQFHDGAVEFQKTIEAQSRIFPQTPLPPGVFAGPVVAFTGEVDPLRMSELVAHEVEISELSGCRRGKAHHLVERHRPVDDRIVGIQVHGKIDLMSRHGKEGAFAPHKGLIVTLHIADGPFISAVVGQFVVELKEIPLLIPQIQHLEPCIGNAHRHAEIESGSPFSQRSGKTGHTAYILSDGDGIGPHFVDHHICQSQIGKSIFIHIAAEILFQRGKSAVDTVVKVEHTGDAVKAESVYPVLIQIETAVGKKQMEHLRL